MPNCNIDAIGAILREYAVGELDAAFPKQPSKYISHEPTEKQAKFLALMTLEGLYGGAAGGGKSDALLMDAIGLCEDYGGYAAIILRRTFRDLNQPKAIMARAKGWLAKTDASWNDNDKRFTFPNGSTLTFGYLASDNDVYQYQSAEFQFIGFDELTQFTKFQYTYMISRCRREKAMAPLPLKVRGATNPGGIGHDWVFNRFIRQVDPKRPFVAAKIEDNPHLDVDEYRESLSNLMSGTRKQLEEGDWKRPAVAGALWKPTMFEREQKETKEGEVVVERTPFRIAAPYWEGGRIVLPPNVVAVAVGLDPTVTDYDDGQIEEEEEEGKEHKGSGDLCGVVIVGVTESGGGIVLGDYSGLMSPDKWALVAINAYTKFRASMIVAEKNQGGALVRKTIQAKATGINIVEVWSHLAKRVRGEPIAALYEQERFQHAGEFTELEAEMVTWDAKAPGSKSPNRVDALVMACFGLNLGNVQGLKVTNRIRNRG